MLPFPLPPPTVKDRGTFSCLKRARCPLKPGYRTLSLKLLCSGMDALPWSMAIGQMGLLCDLLSVETTALL